MEIQNESSESLADCILNVIQYMYAGTNKGLDSLFLLSFISKKMKFLLLTSTYLSGQ